MRVSDITSFRQAEQILGKYIPRPYRSKEVYTLDRIKALLAYVGNPQESFKTIHVAGTSGKTSTTYYAAAILSAAGYTVGLTVSPHVDAINERVQIHMQPLPEAQFCRSLSEFMKLVDASGVTATYYELLVSFAYWEFARQKVDYAVVEVGLGGMLDGTNVIERADKVCVITDIGLDHIAVLGSTLAEISAQKVGIIHDGNHVVMYRQSPEVMQVVEARVQAVNAELNVLPSVPQFAYTSQLPLFQQRNFGLSSAAVEKRLRQDGAEPPAEQALREATKTYIPARMEELLTPNGKRLIMDGAHNNQKITTLLQSVQARYPGEPMSALMSFVDGEESRWQQGVEALLPHVSHLIVTSFSGSQDTPKHSVDPGIIQAYCQSRGFVGVEVEPDSAEALRRLQSRPEQIQLVVGSFYLLNHIRPLLKKEQA